ncbi:hypothetical protein D9615_003660 [Tricholomella constricta]|uniref:Cryptic loci regulator 2 N-terminal domain-containing protein n=1 Tax=Tricholomella constricta TaxID=117010 RepID=A0A8H5HI27_9AGAR|nr:hypothetical protein D9615_003660 [Tricholomella constricta]
MSARRIADKAVEMPSNPHFLDFERSDGDPSSWPKNTTRIVDDAGEINWMKPMDIDQPHSLRWRLGAAKGIAIASNLPLGPTYMLRNWPAGYKFFDHQKGPDSAPRHDLYLYGPPPQRRYRSINEFIPHAIWLYQDATMNPANCQCKYCQKKPQKEVTASLPPGILRTTLSTPTPSRSRPKRPKSTREMIPKGPRDKVYAAVQRRPIPVPSKSSHVHHKATMLVERNSDLRAVSSKTSMKLRRWFRTGELLWCALDPPIKGPGNVAIEFWPGLVDEVKLKTAPIPRHTTSSTRPPLENGNDEDLVIDDSTDTIPWSVRQSTQYRMQLLAVNHSYLVSDDQVLPYQAHVPPNDLILALKAFPTERLNFDREVLLHFNPCPKGENPTFDDAVAPYAMAVQIGSTLSAYWCLTDEWAFEYNAPKIQASSPPRAERSASMGPTSLQAAIETADVHNNLPNGSISSGPSSKPNPYPPTVHYPSVSGPSSDMTPAETQRLSARMLGKVANPLLSDSPSLTQMRFQGVWWGAERIWVDEFIRLKVPRRCIAPKGAEHILAPAGPGKAACEMWTQSGRNLSELGAGARGVFMRLDGLFVVDAVQYDGSTRKECRASGMLYELADIDWEDPDAIKNTPGANPLLSQPSASAESQLMPPRSFIPAPSPLNPHIPPNLNPDPSVLVAPAPSVTEAAQVPPIPNPPLPSSQLSHPSSSHYHLPEAPDGYVFRPILSEGHEAVLSLSMISGRYYPRILSHPLLETALDAALANPLESGGLLESNNLWALEGLSAGFYNSVDPIHYKASRTKMVEDADSMAAKELEIHKQQQLRALNESMEEDADELEYPRADAMDVDY